jgi:hypothetical protein
VGLKVRRSKSTVPQLLESGCVCGGKRVVAHQPSSPAARAPPPHPPTAVVILTYKLAYSLYVMILTCSTLCLTIHMTCMSRSRARLRWRFVIPSGLPMFFACRSIGSESRGIWVVSLYTGVVLGCTGTFGYDGVPG